MHRRWIGPVLVLGMFLVAAITFPALPERIPTHWNLQGVPDGWMDRWPGAFLLPAVALGLLGLLAGLRRIDPKRSSGADAGRTEAAGGRGKATSSSAGGSARGRTGRRWSSEDAYWGVANLTLVFMAALQWLTLAPPLGWEVDVGRGALALIGLLFAGIGLYLPRIEPNWWMGIRTPWTLSSRRVWERTHELGGRTFLTAGLLTAGLALVPGEIPVYLAIGTLVVGAFVPVVYSYFAWREAPETG